ncbi:MAG: RodZ domain-containing protein [Leptospirales bacterium]
MTESVGQILKKRRLEKKLTIKDACDATKLTSRHINALENENFDQFPGETYTMGFLKSYAKFLGLDGEHIVQIYKGSLIEETEAPIQQLTQPAVTTFDYIKKYSVIVLIVLAVASAGLIGFKILSNNTQIIAGGEENSTFDLDEQLKQSLKIPEIDTDHLNLHSGFATSLVAVGKGIDFSIHNKEVYLVLNKLDRPTAENPLARIQISFYPGNKQYDLTENSPITISEPGFEPFKLTLKGATPNKIKLQIRVVKGEVVEAPVEEDTDKNRINNPSNFIIVFEAITTTENYVEIYVDGKLQKKAMLPKGSELYYQANDSIQLKIGNGPAMKIKINGNEHKFGTKPGSQVNKVIRKVKDPVEQTRFTYIVKDI